MSALNEMTIKELIAKHNELVPDTAAHIVKWHGRKDLLVEKVAGVIQAARGTLTIKSVSDALLTAIDYIDEAGKPIGFAYDHVLAKVLEQFPDANTTVKCLRWYNTKLNSDPNVKMPVRPRKRTVAKDASLADQPGQAVDLQAEAEVEEPEQIADPLA